LNIQNSAEKVIVVEAPKESARTNIASVNEKRIASAAPKIGNACEIMIAATAPSIDHSGANISGVTTWSTRTEPGKRAVAVTPIYRRRWRFIENWAASALGKTRRES
jgi:hypothetical protein